MRERETEWISNKISEAALHWRGQLNGDRKNKRLGWMFNIKKWRHRSSSDVAI